MSWRGREERASRWGERARSPLRRSPASPARDRQPSPRDRQRDRRDRHERHDRRDRERTRDRDGDRHARRDRDRDRYDKTRDRRRSPRRFDDDKDIPAPPSPPHISDEFEKPTESKSRSRSQSREQQDNAEDYDSKYDREKPDDSNQDVNASPGDWFCKCGSYNFKRRQICYRRNCQGKRIEGIVYGGDAERGHPIESNSGITKRLLFRRLDALTTEEIILESIKQRCSKSILDSIAGITIGRETLTGASKCQAYINFNSISDSAAAHAELTTLDPPFKIDGREVLVTFYCEPQKAQKPSNTDYAAYYNQMANFNSQSMSEADRVNAAAAVAQSAISAAQARQMSWLPVSVPVFVSSAQTASVANVANVPTGDGKTQFTAPDVTTFLYDETSGYYYDPASGLYYDGNTQYFYNSQMNQYMYWDASSSTYIAASQTQTNTNQPKLQNPPDPNFDNTISKEPEEKKKKENKEDKVKVAKKIAKDMERWARTLNQKKENAKSNIVMEQPLDTGTSKGSADIGFSVLGAGPCLPQTHVRELSPPPVSTDEFLVKKTEVSIYDTDEGIIDWSKLTCLICKRKFPSMEVLTKHKSLSDLHKQNLAEHRKKMELLPQSNGYRDRAAERRMKFGEDEPPPIRKRYEPEDHVPVVSHPPPSVVDTIGGKMLQKMGWSEGRGLGKEEQGRIAPIEAEQRPSLAGLGQKRGIYTPTPGLTYRDTVKKLMIARYKEVVGQEEGN